MTAPLSEVSVLVAVGELIFLYGQHHCLVLWGVLK